MCVSYFKIIALASLLGSSTLSAISNEEMGEIYNRTIGAGWKQPSSNLAYSVSEKTMHKIVNQALNELGLIRLKKTEYNNTISPKVVYAIRTTPTEGLGNYHGGLNLPLIGQIGGGRWNDYTQLLVRIHKRGVITILTRSAEQSPSGNTTEPYTKAPPLAKKLAEKVALKIQNIESRYGNK